MSVRVSGWSLFVFLCGAYSQSRVLRERESVNRFHQTAKKEER